MALLESPAAAPAAGQVNDREGPVALAIAAGLYLVGALLTACALLLPHVASPAGVVAVALGASITAALLFYAADHRWGGLRLAFLADIWGVLVIAALCASAGGADSPFALIYFFAIGHAAAFQPRLHFGLVCVAGLVAYLAPLLYESHVSALFGAVASVGIVLALLTSTVVHLALNRMREQRRQLETLMSASAEIARTLRRSLMPTALPQIAGLELASFFRPLGAGEEVGGDFYDAFGERHSCWLVVGDVCGKGAEAAALTGFLRHTTAAYARQESSPAQVLKQVNRAMLEQDFDGRFATAILAHLRFDGGHAHLSVAAAGHPGALLSRAGGEVLELGAPGTLLGILPDPTIADASTLLAPGDAFALYTDGFAEAHAPRRIVTVAEMIDQLRRTAPSSAQSAIEALLRLIDLERPVLDDIAILAAHLSSVPVTGREAAAPRLNPQSMSVVGSLAER